MSPQELIEEAQRVIRAADEHGIYLDLADFLVMDGDLTLDGMDPWQWLDAMTMDLRKA